MKIKRNLIAVGVGCLSALGSSAALTADDYCSPSVTSPAGVKEMRPLNDGVSFAALSDDGKSIEVYSYKTGEKISTLFSVDGVKGDVRIDSFDGYELSANEKKILIWTGSNKIYRYSFTAEYYVYDILRATLSKVSEGGAQRGATISHDGRMVAYQRDNNIFISNIDYKSDKAITSDGKINEIIYGTPDWAYEEEFGILNTMRWSADDSTLAFVRFDESRVPVYSFDEYRSYCDSDPLGDMYPPSYSYKYPLAGYPNSVVEVLAYNVDNRTTKKMDIPVADSDYVPSMEFDGKGENLMVMVLDRGQNNLRLFKVNPGSTVAREILAEKSSAWLNPSAYQMVRYYDDSFVIGSERSGYRHLYEYDYNGNLKRQITSGNWNVTAYYGKDVRKGLHYVQTTQNGAINRNVAAADSKGSVVMLNGIEGTESASFSRNYSYYLRKYSSATVPPQYTICDSKGKTLKSLEMNGAYAARYASAPRMEFLKVRNADGEEMDAYVIKPDGFDPSRKYPLMMYQYNGPDSQLVLNSWKMDGTYYVASQGYIVAAVDGRGTDNRSREWATCVYGNLGDYETRDQLAGAAYFASLPYVDAERTACFGWSYGGYMTLMELSSPDCRFQCGIAMAPVTDWRFYDSIYTERYMRTPQENEAGYDKASALARTGDVKARLLIMSGTSDDNVHFYNTLKYASKMNYEGQIFDMMALAGFEHSLRMGNARTQLYRKIVDFLDSRLK
ncbi:MAG: S9 family peptidase [Muribaculaceae bacterium]|nr:S9 family peptidase [Muribaculaceae bacterium]